MKVKEIMSMARRDVYKTGERYKDLQSSMIPAKLKAKHLKLRRIKYEIH